MSAADDPVRAPAPEGDPPRLDEKAIAGLLRDLDSGDRAVRLNAVFQLGEVLEGAGARGTPEVLRAIERLEVLARPHATAAPEEDPGAWIRKRAKRALRKIRGGE